MTEKTKHHADDRRQESAKPRLDLDAIEIRELGPIPLTIRTGLRAGGYVRSIGRTGD